VRKALQPKKKRGGEGEAQILILHEKNYSKAILFEAMHKLGWIAKCR
jgi:hypothetical protein